MIVKQILPVSALGNVQKTIWRICKLMLGCERLNEKYVPRNIQFRSSSFENIRNRIHYFPGVLFLSEKFSSNEQLSNMDEHTKEMCAVPWKSKKIRKDWHVSKRFLRDRERGCEI